MKQLAVFLILHLQIFFLAQSPELIFQSGFELSTDTIDQNSGSPDLIGIDESVNSPNIGSFKIQYQGGDSTMRSAEISWGPHR